MSNPGTAVSANSNVVALFGVRLSDAVLSNPTADILANTTLIYQGTNGQCYQSDGSILWPLTSQSSAVSLQSQINSVASSVPLLSTVAPVAESVLAAPGGGGMAARNDHTHPRLTSSTRVTLDSNGLATVTYTRTFANAPVFSFAPLNASGMPVVVEHTGDVMGTGAQTGFYVGCTIRGMRAQQIQGLSGILLIGPLLTALTNYVPFTSAAGITVSVLAIQPSN